MALVVDNSCGALLDGLGSVAAFNVREIAEDARGKSKLKPSPQRTQSCTEENTEVFEKETNTLKTGATGTITRGAT